jgi:hypothetical protein
VSNFDLLTGALKESCIILKEPDAQNIFSLHDANCKLDIQIKNSERAFVYAIENLTSFELFKMVCTA